MTLELNNQEVKEAIDLANIFAELTDMEYCSELENDLSESVLYYSMEGEG